MVNYVFATDEQRELAETVKKIMEKELKPHIEEYEAADGGLGVYPRKVHDILVETGYYGMDIPEEWGGLGLDPVTHGIIIEEMGKVDAGFAFAFASAECQWVHVLNTNMSREEKQMWMDKILAGAIGCFNLTEAGAGSDPAAMRTTAVFDEAANEWVINGTKCFASNGPIADYYITFAWTDKTQRASRGVTAFFVERDRGVKVGKKENKMGLHLSETSEVIYDEVRVPADHVIGEVNKGFAHALGGIGGAAAIVNCCPNLGMAQQALDEAIEYAKTRRQFGQRIIDHQGLGFLIADMAMKVAASRSMLYESLVCARDGIKSDLELMIKCYITDRTMEVVTDAVQVFGGYGYMKDYPMERYMRNAKIFQIFGGTNQIKRKNLIRKIAGKDPEAKR